MNHRDLPASIREALERLPPGPASAPRAGSAASSAQGPPAAGRGTAGEAARADRVPALRVVCAGLLPQERHQLDSVVMRSKRQPPRLDLLTGARLDEADAVIVDTRDVAAMTWSQQCHATLAVKPVIWIDGHAAPPGHQLVRRPVPWSALPALLDRLLAAQSLVRPSDAAATADDAASPAGSRAAAAEPIRVEPGTVVLLVDDSADARSRLRAMLEQRGCEVCEAADAADAIEMAVMRRFSIVLMDVVMPGLDGFEGCRQLKSRLRGAAAVPVIMMTAGESPSDQVRGRMAGCDGFLPKPVDPLDLEPLLGRLAGGAAAATAGPVVDGAPPPAPPARAADGSGAPARGPPHWPQPL